MIAILGGGISGLTSAYELKKAGKDFVLIEANATVGGKIKTLSQSGCILETGPNTVLLNNGETKKLLEELKLWDQLIFPNEEAVNQRFVLKNGKIEAIPTSIKTAFKSKLISASTLLSILSEPLKKKKNSELEESLAAFVKRRLGNQIYEDLVTPFVTGIYAGNPEKMSINYVLNVLKEAEDQYGSILKGMPKIMKAKKFSMNLISFRNKKFSLLKMDYKL